MSLRTQVQFIARCNQICVPTALRSAAYHQVKNCGATMIIKRHGPLEVHAWFRDTQPLRDMREALFILHGK